MKPTQLSLLPDDQAEIEKTLKETKKHFEEIRKKRTSKKAVAVRKLILQRQTDSKPEKAFYPSRLAGVSLPMKTPKKRYWERTNGRDTLVIEAGTIKDPKTGQMRELQVPSGIIPRRILVYMASAWQAQKAQGIRERKIMLGDCLYEFLKNIETSKGGKTYKVIEEQATRLFLAKIALYSKSEFGLSVDQALVASKYELWWDPKNMDQASMFPSWVMITEDFAKFLDKCPPYDLNLIRALGKDCLSFDLYMWLSERHYSIANPSLVKWEALYQQFGAEYARERDFKAKYIKSWDKVKALYPHNSKLDEEGRGILLVPSKPSIPWKNLSQLKAKKLIALEGSAKKQ